MIQTSLFVRLGEEVVLERSLEITEVLRGGGRKWWRQEACSHTFWKKVRDSLSRLSFNEFNLATNKTVGYDMPWVMLQKLEGWGYCMVKTA